MRFLVEIRPGEGGTDAKLLVSEQAEIYIRYAKRHGLNIEITDSSS
jgi:protein subunit release factor A